MSKPTPKQEAFAHYYIETGNASEAYRRAYDAEAMKPEAIKVNAAKLLKNTNVALTISKLQEIHLKRHEVTVDRILSELAKIGFADIRKAVKWHGHLIKEEDNPDGGDVLVIKNTYSNNVSLVSSDELDDATAGAIAEVSQSPTGGLKIKLHDKRAALVDMGRHFGMFKEAVELTGKDGDPIKVEHAATDEIISRIARLAARTGKGEGSGGPK